MVDWFGCMGTDGSLVSRFDDSSRVLLKKMLLSDPATSPETSVLSQSSDVTRLW